MATIRRFRRPLAVLSIHHSPRSFPGSRFPSSLKRHFRAVCVMFVGFTFRAAASRGIAYYNHVPGSNGRSVRTFLFIIFFFFFLTKIKYMITSSPKGEKKKNLAFITKLPKAYLIPAILPRKMCTVRELCKCKHIHKLAVVTTTSYYTNIYNYRWLVNIGAHG